MTEQFITAVNFGDPENLMSVAGAILNRKLLETSILRMAGKSVEKTGGISIVRVTLTVDDSEKTLTPLVLKLEYVADHEAVVIDKEKL